MTLRSPLRCRVRLLGRLAIVATTATLPGCAQPGYSGSSTPGSDVVGGGGHMDDVYREIYRPGTGTNF